MNCYQAALLVALLGFVGSAPLPEKRDSMDSHFIGYAHSFISTVLKGIPAAHASWINSPSLKLGSSVNPELQHLKENLIPSAPVLESISDNFTLEICLDRIFKGLKLHVNLLTEISEGTKLKQTEQVAELQADIEELLSLINKMQTEAGFERSVEASQHDLAKNLKSTYITQVAAHLTLQQLQVFSCDVLRSILSFRDMTPSPSTSEDWEQCP
ncbi:colony stimulating factor 3 (granulocyte) a [Triplophysa rosa]|uniref:Colony stimulating factor 3 granulocyte a n=1 Tax=Triplophysa rosa TaxID=992332 RepID=A0A9W7TGQ7_TRIRA|nr:colony stimulating factor 3 (granulocyte) a [Triplophysa rosa]KAI7797022.1 colony stimulating factor 3 granulocyte a [Triplophysa rosa]